MKYKPLDERYFSMLLLEQLKTLINTPVYKNTLPIGGINKPVNKG